VGPRTDWNFLGKTKTPSLPVFDLQIIHPMIGCNTAKVSPLPYPDSFVSLNASVALDLSVLQNIIILKPMGGARWRSG
jgi:hypothetical protein